MTTKEKIKQVLEKWKFPVLQETDNTLVFRYQMSYIQITISGDEDTSALSLTLTGIFTADNDQEMTLGIRTCNELNCNLFHVKFYIDSDADLVIASEFFHGDPDDMEDLLSASLRLLIIAKKRFLQKYGEMEEEAKLMSELEQE